ncbi:MAG: tripartite tricarboxylate transporter substrate binding protein, partial [Pigmentiphaga sp.]
SGMGWIGLAVRSDTPDDRVARLERALLQAARDPANIARLEAMGLQVQPEDRQAFQARLDREAELWQSTVRRANVTVG